MKIEEVVRRITGGSVRQVDAIAAKLTPEQAQFVIEAYEKRENPRAALEYVLTNPLVEPESEEL